MLPSQNENPSLYIFSANVDDTEKVCAKNDLFRTRIEILTFSRLLRLPHQGNLPSKFSTIRWDASPLNISLSVQHSPFHVPVLRAQTHMIPSPRACDFRFHYETCNLSYSAITEISSNGSLNLMDDYIRTPILPDKCPKCEGLLDKGLQCINGCGYWGYPTASGCGARATHTALAVYVSF